MATSAKIQAAIDVTADSTPVAVPITSLPTGVRTYLLTVHVTGSYNVSIVASASETEHNGRQCVAGDAYTYPIPLRATNADRVYLYADASSACRVTLDPITGEG